MAVSDASIPSLLDVRALSKFFLTTVVVLVTSAGSPRLLATNSSTKDDTFQSS